MVDARQEADGGNANQQQNICSEHAYGKAACAVEGTLCSACPAWQRTVTCSRQGKACAASLHVMSMSAAGTRRQVC